MRTLATCLDERANENDRALIFAFKYFKLFLNTHLLLNNILLTTHGVENDLSR